MLKLKKIAITGGLASGKTTVCRFFQEFGAFVVNTDAIIHELLDYDVNLGQQIIRQFGSVILENGKISRKMIAEKAFKDPELLKALENILHPVVFHKIEELYKDACRAEKYTSFVVEVPLLFEIQGQHSYDYVIAVLTDKATARCRFERAGFASKDFDLRMKRQLSPHQKASRAHFVIHNNGTLSDLKEQVVKLNQRLCT